MLRVPLLTPAQSVRVAGALVRSGLLRLYRPDEVARIGLDVLRYGAGPGVGPRPGAVLYPDAPAIIDDTEMLTFREADERCAAVASGLADAGLRAGQAVGLLARNSIGFYTAMVGAARLGLDLTYLNVGFPPDQVADVVARHGLHAVVCDEELADRVPASVPAVPLTPALAASRPRALGWVLRRSRHRILTSGTSGRPKGATRTRAGVDSAFALLSGLPFRVRETHLVAAPMFHAWGWANTMFTMLLSSTIVVSRTFDAEAVLARVERERVHVLVAVPVMLRRIMDLPAGVRARYDTSTLRAVAVSGSPLSPALAASFMDEFGDILYSLYGSTEAALATVADPHDLRAAPGTAGRPLPGVQVRVVDDEGRDCPSGTLGSVLVGSSDSAAEHAVPRRGPRHGVVRTGDLGWFDASGRLFVGAREDDMVVTGGENVYPVVVEEALEKHPEVAEAAVVPVPDEEFGQVLVAHVALRDGGAVDADSLRAWSKQHLAPYQVPRRVVIHASLPRNEAGKILKRSLPRSLPPP